MVNRERTITMTKLALYDKHEGPSDRAANEYFRHDYIYKKNIGTRVSACLGGIVLLTIYWLRVIFVEGADVFEMDLRTHVVESVLILVAIIALYSLIGTLQGTREYYHVQKRLKNYQNLLSFLEATERKIGSAESPEKIADEPTIERDFRERREARLREREREMHERSGGVVRGGERRPEHRAGNERYAGAERRTGLPDRRPVRDERRVAGGVDRIAGSERPARPAYDDRRPEQRRDAGIARDDFPERTERPARPAATARPDPLANVSARAMSSTRPRPNIQETRETRARRESREESRPRYTLKPGPPPRDG
ncbi:MAG: hypothetical protein FWC70_05350 [Defluviitaleaceae bacterium]|nr:hypothetical protein [Defluviitaleaceae bacterium]